MDGYTYSNDVLLLITVTLLPVVGCGNFVAKLVGVTYSNTFTPYEHTDVVADEVVLALNAVLTVYNAFEMFIDDVAALVRNEPVDAFIALMDPVKYSKLQSSSSYVNGAPLVERNVKLGMYFVYV